MSASTASAASPPLPGRGIKPLVSLLAHPWHAIIVFLLVCLAGLPLVFIKGRPSYLATAAVQVSPNYMKNLRDDGELSFPSNTQYREFFEQQSKSILRYDIVRDALRTLAQAKIQGWRQPGESEREAVDRLRSAMVVNTIPDTYLIEIALQQAKPDNLDKLVNTVVQTYVERMKQERVYGADIRQHNLEERADKLMGQIGANTRQRTLLALELGLSTFGKQVSNPYDRQLGNQRAALADARNKRIAAEAQLKAFERYGETDIETRSIQEAVLIDPGLANLKSNLYKRRADLLIQLSGLTPQHPAYQELQQELKQIEREIDKQIASLSKKVHSSLHARYLNSVMQTRAVEDALSQDLASLEQKGTQFAAIYNQVMELTHDIEQDRKELDAIRDRLNVFAAEANSFGFVRMVTPALPAEQPIGTGKKKLLFLLLMLASAAALLTPITIDLLDRRIHTVNDAERVLGIPALGWMVEKQDNATRLFAEDLLRRLAAALLREHQQQGTRQFAFSAVKPGAGSTELLLCLGQTLTQLGYPTLVVEANAFKPDSRFSPHAGARPGLMACLQNPELLNQALQPAEAGLPMRLAIGSSDTLRHLDQLEQLPSLLSQCQQYATFVLVDIPPLLLCADAELLAQKIPHLVLVVESGATQRGELLRAGRQLEKIQPEAVGVVVNRIRPFNGGGYLRELMIEFLTARKARDYFTRPAWLTQLQAGWSRTSGHRRRPGATEPR